MKIHLGCGHNRLDGWINHDRDVDIRKRLPWSDGVAAFVFAEHVIEHITFPEGVRFIEECRRILRPGGVLRLSFPDVMRLMEASDVLFEAYRASLQDLCERTDGMRHLQIRNRADAARVLLCGWEHRSAWTEALCVAVMRIAGFSNFTQRDYGISHHYELSGIDGHHLQAGHMAKLETTVFEATK